MKHLAIKGKKKLKWGEKRKKKRGVSLAIKGKKKYLKVGEKKKKKSK